MYLFQGNWVGGPPPWFFLFSVFRSVLHPLWAHQFPGGPLLVSFSPFSVLLFIPYERISSRWSAPCFFFSVFCSVLHPLWAHQFPGGPLPVSFFSLFSVLFSIPYELINCSRWGWGFHPLRLDPFPFLPSPTLSFLLLPSLGVDAHRPRTNGNIYSPNKQIKINKYF